MVKTGDGTNEVFMIPKAAVMTMTTLLAEYGVLMILSPKGGGVRRAWVIVEWVHKAHLEHGMVFGVMAGGRLLGRVGRSGAWREGKAMPGNLG